MSAKILSVSRARQILAAAAKIRVLVLGDVMLDQFIWGGVSRISPEAPVPVVDFERESFMPGGAANVARNLTALAVPTELFVAIGNDDRTPVETIAGRAKNRLRRTGDARRAAYQCQNPHRGAQTTGCALTAKRATIWTGV